MKSLLIVGALPDEKNGLQYGGATVLMKNFVDFLKSQKIDFLFSQTNKVSDIKLKTNNTFYSALYFFPDFLRKLRRSDKVMFNFSDHGITTLFPVLSKIARFFGKKIIIRKFGGSFDTYIKKLSTSKQRTVLQAIQKADLILFETHAGIRHLTSVIDGDINIQWFPNIRNLPEERKDTIDYNKKIVFLSHISDEKGVGDLLAVKKLLPDDYEIHFYGAIKDNKYLNFPWESHGVIYHGEISSDLVPQILSQSMLLVLPSSYREGYPGIVIEAFSVGLPVVTSDVGGLSEMYHDGKEGRMIKCGDIEAIASAILSFTPENYSKMCEAAFSNFCMNFEATSTNRRICDLINSL